MDDQQATETEAVRESAPAAENGHASAPLNGAGGTPAEPSLPPQTEAPAQDQAQAPSGPSPLERAGHGVVSAFGNLWHRRGVEATIGGVIAVAVAIWLGGGSALSIPLVVLGVVLLLVGILGRRLRGHVSLEWGPAGASFDLSAAIAPPGRTRVPDAPSQAAAALPPGPATGPEEPEVIESTGETVEIDVGSLRALLAAERESSEKQS